MLGFAGDAGAHDPFQITTDARVRATGLELRVTMLGNTAAHLCNAVDGGRIQLDAASFAPLREAFERCAPGLYAITANGAGLEPVRWEVAVTIEGDVDFKLLYPRPPQGPLRFDAVHLERLTDPTYGAELTVTGEGTFLGQAVLRRDARTLEMNTADPSATPRPSFWAFLRLGISHIVTGVDHLVFLAGLLVVCRGLRSILAIVSCFTVAHSLTLALAALGVVVPSGRIVEPLIGATILFVGVENLWLGRRGREPRGRLLLTLVFGLIHGFGFASALRDLDPGSGGMALVLPLFAFNLGVEVGQVTLVAVVLPLVFRLRRWPAFQRHGVQVVSVGIAIAGAYWLVERSL